MTIRNLDNFRFGSWACACWGEGGEDIMKPLSFTSLCETHWSVVSATLGSQDGQNFQCAALLLGFHFLICPIWLFFYLFVCYSCFPISWKVDLSQGTVFWSPFFSWASLFVDDLVSSHVAHRLHSEGEPQLPFLALTSFLISRFTVWVAWVVWQSIKLNISKNYSLFPYSQFPEIKKERNLASPLKKYIYC